MPPSTSCTQGRAQGLFYRGEAAATLVSLLAHAALLGAISFRAQELPPSSQTLSPLRFSGQTFDIDPTNVEPLVAQATKVVAPPPQPLVQPHVQPQERRETGAKDDSKPPISPPASKPPETTPTLAEKTAPTAAPKASSKQDATPNAEKSSGSYGEEALAPGTVDVYRAFLKTLPLAAKSDPRWIELKEGDGGTVRFIVKVNQHGKIDPIEIVGESTMPPPEHLKRLVTLNRQFLVHGRFALSSSRPTGSQEFELRATISQKSPDAETPDALGVRAFGLRGSQPPTGAYFTYFSGRHVELFLRKM